MMASLNNLSDQELYRKLKSYGITSPVTSASRNILLKKLNHILASEKKDIANSKSDKQRRGDPSPSRLQSSLDIKSRSRSRSSSASSKVKSKADKRGRGLLNNFSSDEEDEQEPDEDVIVPETRSRRSLRSSNNEALSSRVSTTASSANESISSHQRSSSFGRKSVPVVRKQTDFLASYLRPSASARTSFDLQPRIRTEYQYDTGSDSDINDDADGRGNRLLVDSSNSPKSSFGTEYLKRKGFTSSGYDFGSRISQGFKSDSVAAIDPREEVEITSPDDIVSQEPITSLGSQLANGQSPYDRARKITSGSSFWGDSSWWLTSVPFILLILLALFFCCLGFCYLSIHVPIFPSSSFLHSLNFFRWKFYGQDPKIEMVIEKGGSKADLAFKQVDADSASKFPVCKDSIKLSCLSLNEAKNVPELLPLIENTIIPALQQQARCYQCGESPHLYLEADQVVILLRKEIIEKTASELYEGLQGLGKLSALHPNLGIKPVWNEQNLNENVPQLTGLASTSHPTEILCHIKAALSSLLYIVAALFLGSFSAWLGYQIYRYYKRLSEVLEQKSFELVEQILEVLENSCGTDGKEYIAVNHVRDCLIPPRERKAKSDIWNRAVKFIDNHDSRVYREIRLVSGEDCEVWRWVSGAPRSPISCPPKSPLLPDTNQPPEKMWQGQAFESLEDTQNLPPVSPTSCLKIRNMFDCELEYGENWPRRIQDSLLEKCEGIKIVHIAVDRVSKEGCVYVKCVSPEEAGKAYRALHGSWFDGNLVTVKYLRDERYHERFPTARMTTSPLTPSNNKRLSLQQSANPNSVTTTSTTTTKSFQSRYSSRRRPDRSASSSNDILKS